jgi:NADH-quinone oxidoreductase subunit M
MLTWLILIPFIGGFFSWLAELLGSKSPRWISLVSMFVLFGLTLKLWLEHDYSLTNLGAANQAVWAEEIQINWIPRFGISFHLALDGLSILMLLLTSFLGVLAVVCSWSEVQKKIGFFHLNLLWIIGAVVGVFLAMDMFLFFFFWEMMLIPMYFLIALWGHNSVEGKGRVEAATKFFIYTQSSGLLLLLAIIGLVFVHAQQTQVITFDYQALLNTTMDPKLELILMLGFFIAFAVKFPIVPFHAWLPDAHSQAPTAGSVDLAGILLKTAAYGMLRFAIPFFPHASEVIAPVAMWLGVVGIIYGAFLAYGQDDIKRLIAYTSISHMGFVLIGIYSFNPIALQGAVIQMMAHGISAAGLFILCGQLYERLKTRDLKQMGGLSSRMSGLPPIAMFFAAASLGKVNEYVTLAATTGLVLSAVYSLILVQRALHGPASSDQPIAGLNKRELAMMFSLMIILVWLGLYPQPVLDTSAAVVNGINHLITSTLPAAQ